MPIVAVVGAGIGLLSGGAAAIGATAGMIAGTVAFDIGTVATAVAAVGATVGAVGAVAHDKGLETAGLVLGGLGGVTALAANAGLIGADAASASSDASSAISGGIASGTDTGLTSVGETALQNAASNANTDIIDSVGKLDLSSITMPALPTDVTSGLSTAEGNLSDILPAGGVNATQAAQTGASATSAPSSSSASGLDGTILNARLNPTPSGVQFPQVSVQPATPLPPSVTPAGISAPTLPGQAPSGVLGWFKNLFSPSASDSEDKGLSEMAQYGMIQSAGSLISGLFSPVTPAQVQQLDAQASENRAAATLMQQQATNIGQPIPTASRTTTQKPVTSTVTGNTGLINMSPVSSAAVTGQAAA